MYQIMYYRNSLVLCVLALDQFVLSFSHQQQANVFRSSSPGTHWDHFKTWLGALTSTFLPNVTVDLQHLSKEQLDDNLNQLMAHNLSAQAELSERSNALLEQEAAAIKLQAEDAQRNQAQTQHRLDQ